MTDAERQTAIAESRAWAAEMRRKAENGELADDTAQIWEMLQRELDNLKPR